MKAVSGPLPTGPGWRFEPKWDGHRALVRRRAHDVAIVSSSGADRTTTWGWLAEAVDALVPGDVVLDGEVIAITEDGHHEFGLVGAAGVPHAFVVFDLLAHDGESLLATPWDERRALLEQVVEPGPSLTVTPMTEDGDALWEATSAGSFEGVVAKRTNSRYLPGQRSRAWVKTKHRFDQEFLVVGWLPRIGSTQHVGSLLLGAHEGTRIRFVGAAGSGLTVQLADHLAAALRSRGIEQSTAVDVPRDLDARARWVRPELVVQIRHGGWTTGRRLRHAVILGLRDDVDPGTVTATM